MNTLKKVLALTLALVMVFSVASFADETKFNDENTIDTRCVADVKLLAAINILNGFKEGDQTLFKPNETITRGQAAKMIYVVYNGGTDDGAEVYKGMDTFTDTKGHWAEGYINACYTLDIVAGRGNGKFDPDAAVTGSELAKMLLTLGKYRSDVHGFTGADWAKNVNSFADLGGLTEQYKYQISLPAPRQWAAKMFVNALFNCFVAEYIGDNLVTGAYGSYMKDYETIGEKYMGLRDVIAYVSRTENLDISDLFAIFNKTYVAADVNKGVRYGSFTKGKVAIPNEVSGNQREIIGLDFTAATLDVNFPNEMLGHEVRVVYAGNTLNSRTHLYGVFETGATVEHKSSLENISVSRGVLSFGDYKEAITGEDFGDTLFNAYTNDYIDGVLPVFDAEMNLGFYTGGKEYGFKGLFTKNLTWPVRFVDMDGNGIVDMAFVTDSYYAQVARNNTARNLFVAQGAIDRDGMFSVSDNRNYLSREGDKYIAQYNAAAYAKFVGADKVAEGDFVKLTSDVTSGALKINVEALEGTEATVGRKVYGSTAVDFFEHIFKVGDKEFSFSYNYINEKEVVTNNDIVYFTDGKYLVAAIPQDKRADTLTKQFAIVIETVDNAPEFDKYGRLTGRNVTKVNYLNAAGENLVKVYNTSSVRSNFVAFKDILVDGVYEYVENKDGSVYFKAVPTATKNVWFGGIGFRPVIATAQATYGGMLITDDTYFFVRETRANGSLKYSIKKLSDFPSRKLYQSDDALLTDASYAYNINSSNSVRTAYFGTLLFNRELTVTNIREGWLLSTKQAYDLQVDGEKHVMLEGVDETGALVVLDLGKYENGGAFTNATAPFNASTTYYILEGEKYTPVTNPVPGDLSKYYVSYNRYDWIKSGNLYGYRQVDGICELFDTPRGVQYDSPTTFWTEAIVTAEDNGRVQLRLDPTMADKLNAGVAYTLGTYNLHYNANTVVVNVKTVGGEIVYVDKVLDIGRTAPYTLKIHNDKNEYEYEELEYTNAYALVQQDGYIRYIIVDSSYGGSVVGDATELHDECIKTGVNACDKDNVYAGNIYSNLSGGVQRVTSGWNRK